jgi:hypothetical protein
MITFLYSIFLGAWRRWFGGGLNKLPDNRLLQHAVGFAVACVVLCLSGHGFAQAVICSGVLQGLYWAKAHGMCFDYGHGEVDLERYEKMLSWRLIRKYIPEKYWYGYASDFLLMATRYTLPAILMAIILLEPHVALLGLIVSGVYAFFWALYDVGIIKNPTEWAEWIVGALTGLFIGG